MFAYGPGESAERLRKQALGRRPSRESALELGRRAWLERHDVRTARRWIRRAESLGAEDAAFYDTWLSVRSHPSKGLDPDLSAGLALAMAEDGGWFETGKSAPLLGRAARRGDPLAQACYGHVLLDGDGDRPKAARTWLRRAAPHVPWAAAELAGNRWIIGITRAEANRWLRVAADGGVAQAQNDWGETLRDGPESGVRRDLRGAVRWFRLAARQGHPAAQLNLGFCLHEGQGVRRNDRESVRWYRRAARGGQTAAMNNLARCYRDGHGVPKDMRSAIAWFRRSAEARDAWAAGELARIYVWGLGVRANPKKATEWARRVVGGFKDPERAVAAAEGREAEAIGEAYHALGRCAEDGKAGPRDDAASIRYYRWAAATGHSCAMDDLGQAYEAGRGVPKDLRQARKWYVRAARGGDSHAKKWLRRRRSAASRRR